MRPCIEQLLIVTIRALMVRRDTMRVSAAAIVLGCFVMNGCHKKHAAAAHTTPVPSPEHRASKPLAVPVGYTEQGIASWYGVPYHGRAAADGEIYDMETLVAAHRTMPFNTWLRVTNLSNGKAVNVRVIDRGPFVEGRILDLSKAAAREIELIGPGTGQVRLEVIAAPVDVPVNDFYAVQIGAYSVLANAERVRSQYEARFGTAAVAPREGRVPMWRVLVGKEPSVEAAQQIANQLAADSKNVFVVRLDASLLNSIRPKGSGVPVPAESGAAPGQGPNR